MRPLSLSCSTGKFPVKANFLSCSSTYQLQYDVGAVWLVHTGRELRGTDVLFYARLVRVCHRWTVSMSEED
jgi:hypothetical protein